MKKYKAFKTDRLLLRPTSEEDAEFIFELLNTPKWIKYIGDRNIKTIEQAREYIKTKMLPQLEKLSYSNYTVIKKNNHLKIGTCGLYDRDGLEGIDIGFAFLPEYERKGYAFESANKLKEVAFNEFEISEMNAITTKDNVPSQKLLEKLGLKLVGTTKLPDEEEELLLYKINFKTKNMKKMTCKQLGGACEIEFQANTFEEIAEMSKKHGMEMFQKGDEAHLLAMKEMEELMKSPDAMRKWFELKKEEFEKLPAVE